VNRRKAITLLGSAAVAWPLAARAQQASMPVVGFLHRGSPRPYAGRMAGFRQGLGDTGFVEGKDVALEYRWAEGNYERLPEMALDLVRLGVSVIVAGGGIASAPVAKAATSTIPIVFLSGVDPVAAGLVTSLARPGGNVTGVSFLTQALGAKRLGLLNVLAPDGNTVALLLNPTNPGLEAARIEVQTAGRATGRQIHVFGAHTAHEINAAFDAIAREQAGALLVLSDPFFTSSVTQITTLGTRAAIPAVYPSREYAEAGGIVSYGADVTDEYRKAGVYVGRVLRGAKPADLPVLQPTKFELIVNLKTAAKSLGLKIADSFLLLADEVIE
jgi:putative tryptophan/tyrosine transport system substrate-binding protein